jgi:exodeoxyribonuclease V alpha subunit
MTQHLTVRLAWHDNNRDGHVCLNPRANSYCVGTRSLLSRRLARDKRTDLEQEYPGERLDKLMPEYLPPCYWSSGALAAHDTEIVHAHPFSNYRETHRISEPLLASSVYTRPFRLSITHSAAAVRKNGQYPEDLDDRVDRYLE